MLTPEQIADLEVFVFKVSMDGFDYASENYFPDTLPEDIKEKLADIDGESFLESLMEEYGLEWS